MGKSVEISNVPNAPAFRGGSNAITVPTGLDTVTWFTTFSETFDTTSAFDTSTGRFTPTVAGYYQINARVSYSSNGITATYVGVVLGKNGDQYALSSVGASADYPTISVSDVVYLNGSTDYVQVGTKHNASGSVVTVSSAISGALIRPA